MPILKGIQWHRDVYKGFVIKEPDTGKYSIASVITITIKFPTNTTQKATLWNINYKKLCIYRHVVFTSYLGLGSLGNRHWDQCFHVGKFPGAQHLLESEGRTGWGGELWINPAVASTRPRGTLELGGPLRLSCLLQNSYLDTSVPPTPHGRCALGWICSLSINSQKSSTEIFQPSKQPIPEGLELGGSS